MPRISFFTILFQIPKILGVINKMRSYGTISPYGTMSPSNATTAYMCDQKPKELRTSHTP